MKPLARWLFVIAGMLTADAAIAQDFKSQAAIAAAQWDAALNSGDAAKVAQAYTKTAVILPAGAEQVTGQARGRDAVWWLHQGWREETISSPSKAASRKATSAMLMGAGTPMLETKSWVAIGRTCW